MLDERPEQSDKALIAAVESIVGELQAEADIRVVNRDPHEKRWLDNLRQYFGKYDADTVRALKNAGGSQLTLNMTRPKTNALAARLINLLFPADDMNWAIEPTPVPKLTAAAEKASEVDGGMEEAAAETEDPTMMAQAQEARKYSDKLQAQLDEARRRCESMQAEIADVFAESGYEAQNRDLIDDACRVGAGVMKGPVIGDKPSRKWARDELGA